MKSSNREIKFISNNFMQTYDLVKDLLSKCISFKLNVAFISWGGYQILAKTFKELENKSIKGKIITTTYQNFNDPKIFEEFYNFKNCEIKVIDKSTIEEKVK